MQLTKGIRRILSETVVKVHPDNYAIVYIDPSEADVANKLLSEESEFLSLTFTREEVSVVMKASDWEKVMGKFRSYKVAAPYRLITFDIVLDLSIVGFLSVVSAALAADGVSIYALSTYLKDHILVKEEDAGKAVRVLDGLINEAKRGPPNNG